MTTTGQPGGHATEDRIDPDDPQSAAEWARKLDATPEQLREAVAAVGSLAADVELHLKGSRSTTNAERVGEQSGDGSSNAGSAAGAG